MKSEIPQNLVQRARNEDEFEIDDELLEIFAGEAAGLVKNIGVQLEKLEKTPNDAGAVLEIRRSAHTLKGSAGIVGFAELSRIAHRAEDLFDYLAAGKISYGKRIYDFLSTANDCFAALARSESSARITKNIARLDEDFDAITAPLRSPRENSANVIIPENIADTGNFAPLQTGEGTTRKETSAGRQPHRPVVRVSLDKLDDLVKLTGSSAVDHTAFDERFAEFARQISELPANPPPARFAAALDLVKNNFASLFDDRQRLIEDVNCKLLRLRAVSFGSVAGRLRRTVRAACEAEEKFAELFLDGENLEIDTQTLDWLIEPLIHLLRNAVAHGIEAPAARRSLGKPETGQIWVRLRVENSSLTLIVSDDGRGICGDALKKKAVIGRFVSREQAEKMSAAEAFELMFLPGLTTAEKLSQVAGRGVGMNIVKSVIERRFGTVRVDSEAREATTFTLRLPVNPVPKTTAHVSGGELFSAASQLDTNKSTPFADERVGVLIVDDSPLFRRAIVDSVKNIGWQCAEANDGSEALKILRSVEKLPDVILTDAEMPRMNGSDFLAALQENEVFRRIPVIMITSRTSEKYRRDVLDSGASEYLTKPFDAAFLIEKIKSLTRN